jgi:hypothetical protein
LEDRARYREELGALDVPARRKGDLLGRGPVNGAPGKQILQHDELAAEARALVPSAAFRQAASLPLGLGASSVKDKGAVCLQLRQADRGRGGPEAECYVYPIEDRPIRGRRRYP